MGKARLFRNCDERGRPSPPSARRAWASAARARAGMGFLLLAAASASGLVLAQTSGCGRCGAATSSPILEQPPPPAYFSFRRTARLEIPRREVRTESPRRREAGGGSYEVCVRACDGSFFPVTYFGARSRADSLQEVCQSQCPNAKVELYSFPFGGTIDEAVSSTGEPYNNLSNAHKFEQSSDPGCSCRAPGQSWAEALAAAEAKFGGHPHDIYVTAKNAERMSRPVQDPKAKPGADGPEPDAAAPVEPPPGFDINGVDKALSAAAKALSRETSGIRDEDAEGPASFGLGQGRTVDETGPDGSTRKVRILPAAF